jgi:hydrogenase expression/formation protein HypE
VVERGKGDGIFITTTGLGVIEHRLVIAPLRVQPGDVVLLSGDIGRHGMAIMALRDGLAFESTIESDCTALSPLVLALLNAGIEIHCLRDLTRGGLASALVEIAAVARVHIAIDENAIPVCEEVRGACELLGLEPLYVANEGRFVSFVPAAEAEHALAILRAHPLGADACHIGSVIALQEGHLPTGLVTMRSQIGVSRVVDMLSGEQLPRIC